VSVVVLTLHLFACFTDCLYDAWSIILGGEKDEGGEEGEGDNNNSNSNSNSNSKNNGRATTEDDLPLSSPNSEDR